MVDLELQKLRFCDVAQPGCLGMLHCGIRAMLECFWSSMAQPRWLGMLRCWNHWVDFCVVSGKYIYTFFSTISLLIL
jgi:hypothetical protein